MDNKELLVSRIAKIQAELKAPKSQWNDFSKFHYRNCEDILEAAKPLMDGLLMIISDEVKIIGDRAYVCATVTITDGKDTISNTSYAREALTKKGMDDSQITGSTSSYARKCALNGMFLIDDTKDADSMDNSVPTKGGFVLDDTAKNWISSIKGGHSNLEQITDPKYREFIKGKLK